MTTLTEIDFPQECGVCGKETRDWTFFVIYYCRKCWQEYDKLPF